MQAEQATAIMRVRASDIHGLWHLISNGSSRTRACLIGLIVAAAIGASTSLCASARPGSSAAVALAKEGEFLAENQTAMRTMMTGMDIKSTGNIDRDFVDMMVPHHQGAIDMAVAVLRYGRNPTVRRLAQEIIITQQQEIIAMRRAVGEPLPRPVPAPTTPDLGTAGQEQER